MEIALSRVMEAARQRRAAITTEVAGYVVLLAAREVTGSPRLAGPEQVFLDEAGDIRVAPGPAEAAHVAERALRQLLATLVSLCPSPAPALSAAVERATAGDLDALQQELLAALIPLNQAAARRALARLYRETSKSVPGAREITPDPPPAVMDVEIDVDISAGAPSPAPEREPRAPSLEQRATPDPSATRSSSEASNSDLRVLIANFLAETRSEARMAEQLRRIVGVELEPTAAGSAANDGEPAAPRLPKTS